MNTANHMSEEDLALFALQLLAEDETTAVFAHLQECAECRAEVGRTQGDLAVCSLSVEMQAPPAAARDRLLQAVAAEKRLDPVAPITQASTEVGTLSSPQTTHRAAVVEMQPRLSAAKRANWIAWTGWAVAAAFALAAGLQFQQRRQAQTQLSSTQDRLTALEQTASSSEAAVSALTGPGALKVALHQPSAPGAAQPHPEGQAAYLPDRGALVFVATDLEPLKPYKVYELWLLPSTRGAAPIPAASFRPDAAGNANVILPAGPKLISISGFGVTEEDDKTQPKAPTLPILLLGTSRT